MKKEFRYIFLFMIIIVIFTNNKVLAFSFNSNSHINILSPKYNITRLANENKCDKGYYQVGNSNVCEIVYDGISGYVYYDNTTGQFVDNCSSFANKKHNDGVWKETCLAENPTDMNSSCICQYYIPNSGGPVHNDEYDDYDVADSAFNPVKPDTTVSIIPSDNFNEIPDITECSLLLGKPEDPGTPAFYLSTAFHVIKYVALVLMIVLSVMDFTGAIAKQDRDVMAKILKKLMVRFILCIIIFLLPYLLDILLNYLVERQTDLCGIK